MPLLLLLLLVMQPGSFEPMGAWYMMAIPAFGWASTLFGLGWMIRIYRTSPEPGETTWRYRS